MSDVDEPTEDQVQAEMEWRGEEEAERRAAEPARPVEDREPVGPYAPTRAEGGPISGGQPLHVATEQALTGLRKLASTVAGDNVRHLVDAGMTASSAAKHIEELARIRAESDSARARIRADQDHYRDGFRAGVKIGAAEQESRQLDDEFVETETPSAYDVAERALDYATRLVRPIDASERLIDDEFGPVASHYARLTTDLADRLFGWLWQYTDMDGPERAHAETCGSCSQPRERHDPGCLYAPRERTGDPWEGATGVIKSDTPMRFEPGSPEFKRERENEPIGDPWGTGPGKVTVTMTQGGFVPSEAVKQAVVKAVAERYAEAVEDGPAPTPEQQACPECRQGKHDNCPGRVIDEQAETSQSASGPLKYLPCPCAGETHPESLG